MNYDIQITTVWPSSSCNILYFVIKTFQEFLFYMFEFSSVLSFSVVDYFSWTTVPIIALIPQASMCAIIVFPVIRYRGVWTSFQ